MPKLLKFVILHSLTGFLIGAGGVILLFTTDMSGLGSLARRAEGGSMWR